VWRDRLSSSIELLQFQPVTAARRQMALAEICHDIESLCVSKNVCKIMRPFFTWPRERLRSIVMSMSVCPRGYLRNHTRDLYRIFVHVAYAYVRGSVLLRHVDDRPHRG